MITIHCENCVNTYGCRLLQFPLILQYTPPALHHPEQPMLHSTKPEPVDLTACGSSILPLLQSEATFTLVPETTLYIYKEMGSKRVAER